MLYAGHKPTRQCFDEQQNWRLLNTFFTEKGIVAALVFDR